ncbi:hypothetical protein [Caballeronia hypogeia]|uniref:hypothetical protein n=1 Tax=Caballeronia hypogeia TaxID=1777140 RepID=UPI000772BA8C|nr:hypothetical protein [Caballeronia hypogeia]
MAIAQITLKLSPEKSCRCNLPVSFVSTRRLKQHPKMRGEAQSTLENERNARTSNRFTGNEQQKR